MLCTVFCKKLKSYQVDDGVAHPLAIFTRGHGMYVWIVHGGWIAALQIDGDGEGVEGEEVDGIRFDSGGRQRLIDAA